MQHYATLRFIDSAKTLFDSFDSAAVCRSNEVYYEFMSLVFVYLLVFAGVWSRPWVHFDVLAFWSLLLSTPVRCSQIKCRGLSPKTNIILFDVFFYLPDDMFSYLEFLDFYLGPLILQISPVISDTIYPRI